MRWHNRAQANRVAKANEKAIDADAATRRGRGDLSKSKSKLLNEASASAQQKVEAALPEPPLLKNLWAIKGYTGTLWNMALALAMVLTSSLLIELVVVIIVAVTVDPFRPLAVLSVVLTLVFYVINGVEGFNRMRKKFADSVKEQYLAKHSDGTATKKEMRKVMEKLSELIDDELDKVRALMAT